MSSGGYTSTKSAGLAVLFSAGLPGLGQIYNESYWKTPIIWALGGYWVSQWVQLNDKYRDYRGRFEADPTGPESNLNKRVRDFYRDERDKFAWYLGALYVLNLLDAYVDANLYDFDVGGSLDHIRVGIEPSRISFQFRF